MAEHQPDEHYAEFLNITLQQAFDEWKILTIDVGNIQSNSLKTYLWLNALVTTGLFSLIAYADPGLYVRTDAHLRGRTGHRRSRIHCKL